MTIQGDHAMCDGCEALTPTASERFEHWETTVMQDGPDTHLCDKCQTKRDRGWLADDVVLECVRCGRNSKDNPELKRWHKLPRHAWDDPESPQHVCADCFRPEDRFPL